ncbi:unnamed protein product [Phytophthora fragariaefolia]|uniref:diacylglycerol O-acyltransferase n=1 Tax=Phytophthora fragariaefolia TaxID=1490495 RepID=A0A9W7D246_9STRA|nr:unnamed protein product [Phytophthora fragariaefolia]
MASSSHHLSVELPGGFHWTTGPGPVEVPLEPPALAQSSRQDSYVRNPNGGRRVVGWRSCGWAPTEPPSLTDRQTLTENQLKIDRLKIEHFVFSSAPLTMAPNPVVDDSEQQNTNVLVVRIIREQELDSSKQYIFGFHPHGIIVLSRIAIFGGSFEDIFPGITYRSKVPRTFVFLCVGAHQTSISPVLGASPMFYIPLGRELCLWMGGVDASRSTGEKVLKEGNSIVVYPGGVAGIFKTNPKSKKVSSSVAVVRSLGTSASSHFEFRHS